MAKKHSERLEATVENLRPYIERALKDEEFRTHVREAFSTARQVYGDLAKQNGLGKSARKLATDRDLQENLRKALEELGDAAETVQGKRRSRKRSKKMLVAGLLVGALYNPWTGPQTRHWLLDKIAGGDELEPLDVHAPEPAPVGVSGVATNGGETAAAESTEATS
ncbi:MAG TPA: hypothetical protein VFB26_08345 [Gaiellaceae bacterium]|nr:hypothetical protein [Gaiellaceae bacterium]